MAQSVIYTVYKIIFLLFLYQKVKKFDFERKIKNFINYYIFKSNSNFVIKIILNDHVYMW